MSAAEAIVAARAAGVHLGIDGSSLVLEAQDTPSPQLLDVLRAHKFEILDMLRDERRAVLVWINDNFRASQFGACAHCGGGECPADPFVLIFVGETRADIHASCHPAWNAQQEAKARVALGIENPNEGRIDK
jgi:hypothetical protein